MVLDTNVLISAILGEFSLPGRALEAWYHRKFTPLSCMEQIEEVRRVSAYPHLAPRLPAFKVGRLINDLREVATMVTNLPLLDVSTDPFDNYLLSLAQKGKANFLVTGDKADLLGLDKFSAAKIIAVRQFAMMLAI